MVAVIFLVGLLCINIFLLRTEEWDQISRDAEEEKY